MRIQAEKELQRTRELLGEAEKALEHVAKYGGHVTRCQPDMNCRGGCDQARHAEQALAKLRSAREAKVTIR